jgi:hypothetical protein
MASADSIITQAMAIATDQNARVVTYAQAATAAADGSYLAVNGLNPVPELVAPSGSVPVITAPSELSTDISAVPGAFDYQIPIPGSLSPDMPSPVTTDVVAYITPDLTPSNYDASYQATEAQLVNLAATNIATVLTQYFPTITDGYDAGTNWLTNTISNGGTGIPAAIEAQIWQRSRDRITVDNTRAAASAYVEFSARGFPMPTGALAGRLQEIRFDGLAKTADQSRETAIKQIDIEITNIRFAVEHTLTLRHQAVEKALGYIREILSTSGMATQNTVGMYSAQAELAQAAGSYFTSKMHRDDLLLKAAEVMRTTNLGLVAEQIKAASEGRTTQLGLVNASITASQAQRTTELALQENAIAAVRLDKDSALRHDANRLQASQIDRGTQTQLAGVTVENYKANVDARVNASLGACNAAGNAAAASLSSINAIASVTSTAA